MCAGRWWSGCGLRAVWCFDGSAEAIELRDGDPAGLLRARLSTCRGERASRDRQSSGGNKFFRSARLRQCATELDSTANKSRLGANAILAVSVAYARAVAAEKGIPLYDYFAEMLGMQKKTLPRLTINLFSGGKHAGGQVPVQDVLVVPLAAATIDDSLAATFAVYQAAADLREKYGMRALTADEGGLAPPFLSVDDMLSDAVTAIRNAGFEPGRDVALAIDVASTDFYENGRYQLQEESLDSLGMIDVLENWLTRFPILSTEDGLAENDWEYWPVLCKRLGDRSIILGDDLSARIPTELLRRFLARRTAYCSRSIKLAR